LIAVNPLPGPLGAEVAFDYNGEWDDDTAAALREAFGRYHLILLRAPDLLVAKQIEFMQTLGLEPDKWLDGEKFGYLSNSLKSAPNDGQHSAYLYHSDLMWKPAPISAISLYAIAVPSEPSPTFFASGVGAAAALPDHLRAQWASEEGESIRRRAHEYLYDAGNVYRHDWRVGDLVAWNNVALQHARERLPGEGERTFRRVSGTRSGGISGWETNYKKANQAVSSASASSRTVA
jgi:alpha-ketoglutarate-dependent taurine dioxygenase